MIHEFYQFQDPVLPEEIQDHDVILLIGTDASKSHPLIENKIRKASKAGKHIIYAIDAKTRTSLFAHEEIFFKKGKASLFLENDLEKLLDKTDGSLKLLIIAGGEVVSGDRSVSNILLITGLMKKFQDKLKARTMFLLNEGNVYGSATVGMNPCYLPGLQMAEKSGKTGEAMIRDISKKGTRALMVFGDIPPQKKLEKLELLIQCNLFHTDLTDFADVFLPVPGFVETSGHIMAEDREVKTLNAALDPPEEIKQVWETIGELAKQMGAGGFEYNKALDIYKELWPFLATEKMKIRDSRGMDPLPYEGPDPRRVKPDYHILGNDLCRLSSDLRIIHDHEKVKDGQAV
jgi:predicted molibdopterin-dependent oxidoreductase YjgC